MVDNVMVPKEMFDTSVSINVAQALLHLLQNEDEDW